MTKEKSFEQIVKNLSEASVDKNSLRNKFNSFNDGFNVYLEDEYEDSMKYIADKQFFEESLKRYENRKGPFSDYATNPLEKVRVHDAFQKYKNQVVFDLGSGVVPENTYALLNKIGIRGYVGVEPFNYEEGKENFELDMKYFKENNYFLSYAPYKLIKSDMKSVLEKIPDNSSSFIASGIDWSIIKDNDYFEECNNLIRDKLHPEGVFISLSSDFFRGSNFDDLKIWQPRNGYSLRVVEKKK